MDKEDIEKNDGMKVKEYNLDCRLKVLFYSCFFLLGIINNLGYVLIQTGSSSLSNKFGNDNLIALYQISLIVCSSLTRIINSKYLIKISYRKRITFLSFYFLSGYLILYLVLLLNSNGTIGNTVGFILTMIPSFIMGTGSALGEATIIGSLRNYPKNLITGWSSGTGLAGITGALLTLIFKIEEIQTQTLYLITSPLALIYLGIFIYQENYFLKQKNSKNVCQSSLETDSCKDTSNKKESSDHNNEEFLIDEKNYDGDNSSTTNNFNLNIKNFKLAFGYSKFFIINLGLVYFLEYTILYGFAHQVNIRGYIPFNSMSKDLQFIYFCLMYQIGVFISRSSLLLIKNLERVDILTYIQLFNFLLWFFEVYFNFLPHFVLMFILLLIVGLMGGSSYVLCFYKILNSDQTPLKMKELSVNIATICNDTGIFLSSVCVLIFDNTIMKKE